jgi:RNA polymerase primary sigma factor
MESMSTDRANGSISPRVHQGEEAPELLPDYFARIGKGKLLTHEEEVELSRRAEAGDRKARRRLIEKNLRLVVSVAKKYRGMGMPFEDVIQEGNIGLMKAVERFDPDLGHRAFRLTLPGGSGRPYGGR